MTKNEQKNAESDAPAVAAFLPSNEMCEHLDQLGELIHWQTTININTGKEGVIPTLDRGRGRNRQEQSVYYCPVCGQATFKIRVGAEA